MKANELLFMFKNIYKLTSIPATVYNKDTVIGSYPPPQNNVFAFPAYTNELLHAEQSVVLKLSPQSLMFAAVKCMKSPFVVLLGPVKTTPINNTMLREIILDNNLHLEDADALQKQLNSAPTMRLEYFSLLLSSFQVNVNHTIVEPQTILDQVQFPVSEIHFDSILLTKQEQIVFGDKLPHNTYDYEQKMLYCVKNGLVEDLHKLGNLGSDSHVELSANEPLRHYKNLVLAQKTLISRAAIEGGANPETVYSLSDIFSLQIENCNTVNEISNVSYAIRDKFCKLVREVQYHKTDDLHINRALTYINEHITERITAAQIAEALDISRVYLSSRFAKTVGVSIPDFINEQKIRIAKKLLKCSDKPLVAIANYLSYSSQSHFQVQFKKVTGLTPLEYKNSNS